jgi:hypothetical protein
MPEFTETQQEVADWVLHWYGVPGHPPAGSFSTLIIAAYSKADPGNKARLRLGFPEIAEAMDLVNKDKDWQSKLEERTK